MRKRMFAIIFLVSVSMIVIVFLFSSFGANVDTILVNDPNRYMKINKTTEQLLDKYAKGILPATLNDFSENLSYEYKYNCALLGEPACSIYLCVPFGDNEKFNKELKRVEKLAAQSLNLQDGMTVHSSRDTLVEDWNLLNDNVVEDGRGYIFEFAIIDYDNQEIQYLFAIQGDGQVKNSRIIELLEQTYD